MEIASPLPLAHNRAGSKRSYCTSPFLDTADHTPFPGNEGDCSMAIDETTSFANQPFKRRRFIQNDSNSAENSKSHFPIFAKTSFSATSTHGPPNSCQHSSKRSRSDHGWNQAQAKQQIALELQRVVDQQAAEIERLKKEKKSLETSFKDMSTQNEKVTGENRILKRAVTIQQERQNQSSREIEAACKYRVDAEERIRKLEQMNLNLQYLLQSQGTCNGDNFMGFSPRPPDVF